MLDGGGYSCASAFYSCLGFDRRFLYRIEFQFVIHPSTWLGISTSRMMPKPGSPTLLIPANIATPGKFEIRPRTNRGSLAGLQTKTQVRKSGWGPTVVNADWPIPGCPIQSKGRQHIGAPFCRKRSIETQAVVFDCCARRLQHGAIMSTKL